MSYTLSTTSATGKASGFASLMRAFADFLPKDRWKLVAVILAVILNIGATVATPFVLATSIDQFVAKGNINGLGWVILGMSVLYVVAAVSAYVQLQIMGHLSQSVLFDLRSRLFAKLQSLPIAFFHQNKAGDLISRVNNDTDRINQFFSESLVRFFSIFLQVIGIGAFMLALDARMALVTMSAIVVVVVVNVFFSPSVKRATQDSQAALGELSADVQESLGNFKALVAFNRQGYFRERFEEVNADNRRKAVRAQVSAGLFNPLYSFAGNLALAAALMFGLHWMVAGSLTVGVLIGFLAYAQKFYEPLRILGAAWGSFQTALGAWSRVQEIMSLENNLTVLPVETR